jgi:hypothetical protein
MKAFWNNKRNPKKSWLSYLLNVFHL